MKPRTTFAKPLIAFWKASDDFVSHTWPTSISHDYLAYERYPLLCANIFAHRLRRSLADDLEREVADRKGFEPSRRSPAYALSRRAPSTTRPPVRGRVYVKAHRGCKSDCDTCSIEFGHALTTRVAATTKSAPTTTSVAAATRMAAPACPVAQA